MPELQITQEYLGQSIHLVFLATMWEEFLNSDTYQQGEGSTVARCTDGSIYPQEYTAIVRILDDLSASSADMSFLRPIGTPSAGWHGMTS